MQTFLLFWVALSMAAFAAALIVRAGDEDWPQEKGRVVILAAFWLPIVTGFLISFVVWWARKAAHS